VQTVFETVKKMHQNQDEGFMLKPTNDREHLIAELAQKYHAKGLNCHECVQALELVLQRPLTDVERIIAFEHGKYGNIPSLQMPSINREGI
jgi:hypothetical protein